MPITSRMISIVYTREFTQSLLKISDVLNLINLIFERNNKYKRNNVMTIFILIIILKSVEHLITKNLY